MKPYVIVVAGLALLATPPRTAFGQVPPESTGESTPTPIAQAEPANAAPAGAPPTGAALATPPVEDEDLARSVRFQKSLRVYGFSDFSYQQMLIPGDSGWHRLGLLPKYGQFWIGNLNLYLDARLTPRVRALFEIRATYLPNGPSNKTDVYDYETQLAKLNWGGIFIERAWIEYQLCHFLTIRGGQFFTPYGIWTDDHGSPTVLTMQKPQPISTEIMPDRQVGLEAYGSRYLGDARLGYHLTFTNGRIGANPQFRNTSGMPAIGGRLFVQAPWLGRTRLGVSAYAGRYTERKQTTSASGAISESVTLQYDEMAVAADLKWEYRTLVFLGEAVYQKMNYTDQGRPLYVNLNNPVPPFPKMPNRHRAGGYAVLGYRLPYGITPYFMFSRHREQYSLLDVYTYAPGVNWRIQSDIVTKFEYSHATFPNAPNGSYAKRDPLDQIKAQVAFTF